MGVLNRSLMFGLGLVAGVLLGGCKTKPEKPSPFEIENSPRPTTDLSSSTKVPEVEKTATLSSENFVEKPEIHSENKSVDVEAQTPPESEIKGTVLFKALDHCSKNSDLLSQCKSIPREGFRAETSIDPISPSDSPIVTNGLIFEVAIKYQYLCTGRQDETFLKLNDQKSLINHGDGEVTFFWSPTRQATLELIRNSRSFTSVDPKCAISIVSSKTKLPIESRWLIQKVYPHLPEKDKLSIKTWVTKETERANKSGIGDYSSLLNNLN